MKMNRGKPFWERWEDTILERDYTAKGWKAVQAQLPHRSKGSITARANALGLRGTKERQRRKPRPSTAPVLTFWTPEASQACQLMRAWRGTTATPNLGLRP